MKKFVFLTGTLALVACGGGSGGGSGGDNPHTSFTTQLVSSAAITSNKNITGMVSGNDSKAEMLAYVESKLCGGNCDWSNTGSAIDIGRRATTRGASTINGIPIESVFNLASESGRRAYEKFSMNTYAELEAIWDAIGNDNKAKNEFAQALKFAGYEQSLLNSKDKVWLINEIIGYSDKQDLLDEMYQFEPGFQHYSVKLDDVKFTTVNDSATGGGTIKFKIDNSGKIVGLTQDSYSDGLEAFVHAMKRQGDTDTFDTGTIKIYEFSVGEEGNTINFVSIGESDLPKIKLSLLEDLDRRIVGGDIDEGDRYAYTAVINSVTFADLTSENGRATLETKLYGTELGLKYSDFGFLDFKAYDAENSLRHSSAIVLAGGYNTKEIQRDSINSDVDFTGIARGRMVYESGTDDNGYRTKDSLSVLDLDGAANLHFDKTTGVETLTANFSNWYDMTATNQTGHVATVAFDNYTNVDTQYQFSGGNTHSDTTQSNGFDTDLEFKTHYFGDNGKPTEAVGVVKYGKDVTDSGIYDKKMFEASFGATK